VETSSTCPKGQVCTGAAGTATTSAPALSAAANRPDHIRLWLKILIGTSDLAADLHSNLDKHGLRVATPTGESLCPYRLT
jgi:hypothetical protein